MTMPPPPLASADSADPAINQLQLRLRDCSQALALSQARLSSLLTLSADWIWEQDAELRFCFVSEGIEAVAGIEPQRLIGRRREFNAGFDMSVEDHASYCDAVARRAAYRDLTTAMVRPDGVRRYVRISGEPVFDADGQFAGYRGVSRDVTRAALAELKVQELARYDSLTGLPNRNLFLSELDRAIARAQRLTEEFALCFIDLDRFKIVNDTLGHDAGDELLRVMSARLKATVRGNDLVARPGGDEFVVLLEGGASATDLSLIGHKLLATIAEPVQLQGLNFWVTGSVGIAIYPADGTDAATLLKHADAAMYLAKERGKNNVQFCTVELADEAAREIALEAELRLGIVREEFVLHYQPLVQVASHELCGVEALLRWQHPQRGLLMPADFMPLAEERGLILPLGRWVLDVACRQAREWGQPELGLPWIAVNISQRQFCNDGLVDDLRQALDRHGLAAQQLRIELTEAALMVDKDRSSMVLAQLDMMGIQVAIDDFGTGTSSLSHLLRFPAQVVKIDGSFIAGLATSSDDMAITQAVIAMAHSLGRSVVAEGVETAEQLALLQRLGCDMAQGYWLGAPMPAGQLAQRLEPTVRALPDAARPA